MHLRRFSDATLHDAMAQVRAALGPEALILATRRIAGGVEVTAALDQPDPPEPRSQPHRASLRAAAGPRAASPPRPQAASIGRASEGEEVRLAQLDWHGVPVALARRLRAGPLAFALSLAVRFAPLDLSDPAPILLAGPPGAGKTLTVVRLAARMVLAGARPLIVCADGARAGAAEQLAAFTRLLGLELVELASPAEAKALLRERPAQAPALIDTAGGDPWGRDGVEALCGLAAAARARMVAVLPAGLDSAEAADLAAGYAEFGATALVATRLDVTRRLGGVLSAAAAGLALVELGLGAGAADGLVPASPDLMARRLLAPQPGRRSFARDAAPMMQPR